MTLEQMQEIVREVVEALKAAGYGDAEYLAEHEPGDPLPIAFTAKSGDEMVLELGVL